MSAIIFDNVSKRFVLHHEKARSFQDLLVKRFSRRSNGNFVAEEEFWALRNISFEVPQGQMIGIIGPNGAGKSTTLKLIARVYEPTRGKITVKGKLNALIELSAGFHQELTGRENIYLSGALLGLSRREIQAKFDEIVAFSELEKFIDTQVKHYSSGMSVRLGFSVATCIESDILLVDEVLAVGDASFHRKCMERIAEIRERGTTIFFVSHQVAEIERQCERVLLIVGGKLVADDKPNEAIKTYEQVRMQRQGIDLNFYNAEYVDYHVPADVYISERTEMTVTICNRSRMVWNGQRGSGSRLVSLSYHWLDRHGNIHQLVGPRTMLPHDVAPNESITLENIVIPPNFPGIFRLEIDMMEEGRGWFSRRGCLGPQIEVRVHAADEKPRDALGATLPETRLPVSR